METDIDAISMLVKVDRACPETLPQPENRVVAAEITLKCLHIA